MPNVKFKNEPIKLLQKLDDNDISTVSPYYIFSPEEAKIVYAFLQLKSYGRPVSVSFWDNSKTRIAFKKSSESVMGTGCQIYPPVSLLKEHEIELQKLFSAPLNKELIFFNEMREMLTMKESKVAKAS